MRDPRPWFLAALAAIAASSRLVPHPPNFAPMTAVAVFGAATFARRRSAALVTFGSLSASDVLLHLTYLAGWQPSWGFYRDQWVVYGCMLAALSIGSLIRRRISPVTIAAATLASSLCFFLATNFAAWASASEGSYPRSLAGLLLCYEAALPFWRNALAGDAFYTAVLFGCLALGEARYPALRPSRPAAAIA